jgi:hypothetical protein
MQQEFELIIDSVTAQKNSIRDWLKKSEVVGKLPATNPFSNADSITIRKSELIAVNFELVKCCKQIANLKESHQKLKN